MAKDELEYAISVAKEGDKGKAIPLLKNVLKTDRNNEIGWLWLAFCLDKTEDKKYCLDEILRFNPSSEQAKKALEQLESDSSSPSTNEGMRTNDKVKQYLQHAKEEELIKRNLYSTKFYDKKEVSKEMKKKLFYSETEQKYYENIPYDVTDEEFNEIMKIPPLRNKTNSTIGEVFNAIGMLIIFIGFVGGIGAGQPGFLSDSGFNWQLAFIIWSSAFFSGMIFLGFGMIIELLNNINNK